MSNDELIEAIRVAHYMVGNTAPSDARHIPWIVHFKMLLEEQRKRATQSAKEVAK